MLNEKTERLVQRGLFVTRGDVEERRKDRRESRREEKIEEERGELRR